MLLKQYYLTIPRDLDVEELVHVRRRIAELREREQELRTRVIEKYGVGTLVVGKHRFTIDERTMNSLNTIKLKKDNPSIQWSLYERTTKYMALTVNSLPED